MTELVSLVVQSKKALQQAEATCSATNHVSRRTSDLVLNVIAAEAKLKWLSDGVLDQLDSAKLVAQSLQRQRASLQSRASNWDSERMAKAHSLESILETLSLQLVPPSLHHVASSSSLFGSQHSDEQRDSKVYDAPSTGFLQSAQEIRKLKDSATLNDRTRWKSLRDFVDERGIDEAAEAMDVDRTALDNLLASTASYPDLIYKSINAVRSSIPSASEIIAGAQSPSFISPSSPSPLSPTKPTPSKPSPPATSPVLQPVHALLMQQDQLTGSMAQNLEGLAHHYGQLTSAMRDFGSTVSEANSSPTLIVGSAETYKPAPPGGFSLSPPMDEPHHPEGLEVPPRNGEGQHVSDQDMQVFVRDTEELPAILLDIEEAASQVNDIHARFQAVLDGLSASVVKFESIIDSLDALADTMATKMREQQKVETESYALHETLDAHLGLFDELSQTYMAYHTSYQKLLLEMDRRRRTRDAMEELVHDLVERLEQMRDDEVVYRDQFIAEHGNFLPDDLCPFVADRPDRWEVQAIGDETLPHIQESVLNDARGYISRAEDVPSRSLLH